MTTALVPIGGGAYAKVAVFRNGDRVTLRGIGKKSTPAGDIDVQINTTMNVATYEWSRQEIIKRVGTLAYTRMIGRLGIDDDIRRAPPLPQASHVPPRMLR